MIRRAFPTIAGVVFLLSHALLSSGQSTTSQITGMITDATGARIPGARVTVTNLDTGIQRTVDSNELGYYTVALLQPGKYRLTCEKQGFRRFTRSGITLMLNQLARVDLLLEIGDLTQSIVVQEDVPLLQTDRADSSTVITTTQFDRLPLIQQNRMRNPVGLVYMTPRVQGSVVPDGSDNVGATTQIRFGAGQQFESEVAIEGIPGGRTQLTGSITEAAPPLGAVREFEVTNSLTSAEWGDSGIGVVSLQLKSGINQFHGTAFEYLRNDKLDVRSWLATAPNYYTAERIRLPRGRSRMGPKLYHGKDRTFSFFPMPVHANEAARILRPPRFQRRRTSRVTSPGCCALHRDWRATFVRNRSPRCARRHAANTGVVPYARFRRSCMLHCVSRRLRTDAGPQRAICASLCAAWHVALWCPST